MKSGNLNFLEPSGELQACNGTAFPLLRIHFRVHNLMMATWGPKHVVVVNNSIPTCYLIKYLIVFMTVDHTYFYLIYNPVKNNRTHIIYCILLRWKVEKVKMKFLVTANLTHFFMYLFIIK
jgi:hypothetical protein